MTEIMRSFRLSEQLQEMIQQECERRNTNFSAFMRYAVVVAMHHRGQQDNGAVFCARRTSA
jgi:hypothetical protein